MTFGFRRTLAFEKIAILLRPIELALGRCVASGANVTYD